MRGTVVHDTGHVPFYRKPLIDKYLERYIESHMTDEVSIYRGVRSTASVRVYQGQARIHRLAAPVQMGFGDEPQYMVSGTISLPMVEGGSDLPVRIRVNDHVVVDDHYDTAMIGRTFRVMHIDTAGLFHNTVSLSVVGSEESPTTERLIVQPLEVP